MLKYGVFTGPYFPVFGLNTGKYGPEKTPYSDTFRTIPDFHPSVMSNDEHQRVRALPFPHVSCYGQAKKSSGQMQPKNFII